MCKMETYTEGFDQQNLKVTAGAHDLEGVIGISLDGVLLFPSLELTKVPEKHEECCKEDCCNKFPKPSDCCKG